MSSRCATDIRLGRILFKKNFFGDQSYHLHFAKPLIPSSHSALVCTILSDSHFGLLPFPSLHYTPVYLLLSLYLHYQRRRGQRVEASSNFTYGDLWTRPIDSRPIDSRNGSSPARLVYADA